MEATHLVQHRTHILVGKLIDVELVVEVAVPEHEVLPEVDVLPKQLGVLLTTLILDERWIEEALRDLDVAGVLRQLRQASESLSSKWARTSLIVVGNPEVRNARNQSDECLLRAKHLLYETEVSFEWAFVDPYPLVWLDGRLLHH